MRFLRTNTAVIVTVGPFYDRTDGVTIETGLTITNERITLTADTDDNSAPTNILDNVTGATSGTSNDLNYITGNDAGMMQLELSAANTNRLGRMLLSITDAANHVPVFHEFMVLPAMIYDAFILGTDTLDASITQLLGNAIATPTVNGVLEVDITHIAGAAVSTSTAQLGVNAVQAGGTAWGSGAITAASIATGAIDADAIADGAIDAAAFAAGAITATVIATGAIDADAIADNAIDAGAIAVGAIEADAFAAGAIDAAAVAADAGTEIATAVWASAARTLTALDEDSTTLDLDATVRSAVGLATANLDTQLGALPTAAENAEALLDTADGIEAGLTPREALRLIVAVAAGKLSGAGTATEVFRNAIADSKDRITATVDEDGNRATITVDLS